MKNMHMKESKIEKERIKVPLRSEETSEVPTYLQEVSVPSKHSSPNI